MTAPDPTPDTRRRKARWRSWLSVAGVLALTATGLVLVTSRADAAVIHGAIKTVAVTPTNPAVDSQITTTLSYCVPNGTVAGDTFTLQLAPQLTRLPAGSR